MKTGKISEFSTRCARKSLLKRVEIPIWCGRIHYEKTPMQHTAIFHGCKNDNFQLKFSDYFHIFAQSIDCGYTLEPPQ